MNKFFNDIAILSTQNPEAFIVYEVSVGDPSLWIVPKSDCSNILINGLLPLSTTDTSITKWINHALTLNEDTSVAAFHIYTRDVSNFDASILFNSYTELSLDGTYVVSSSDFITVYNRPTIVNAKEINIFENNVLSDEQSSYLILRTNPKFTGNIKLVIDISNNLYLDTFKISDILSNKKYRRQKISTNSNLSGDIRNTFSSLPLGELYKNDIENTLNISIPKTELSKQYITTYNYGARLFEDELYEQDYSLLAPLWINSNLPNYFCVFRMPGVYNSETYAHESLSDLAFKYLEESNIIKTYSLQAASPLGKYLTTHINDFKKYPAPVFLSLTNPNLVSAESDPNTWYGISVKSGVVTGHSETPYFFNKTIDNLTNLNTFVSQGFERNELLCPNLLNLEYIFNDNDVSLYTMNRYFGLYLTENILYNISYYSDVSGGSIRIISHDDRDSSVFINSGIIFDYRGDVNTTYKNRLFVLNDGITLNRITNNRQIKNVSYIKNYISKPYKNLFEVEVDKKELQPFITLTLNKPLKQGEHLRIINKSENKIWEAYGIDSNIDCQLYVISSSNNEYPTVYQTIFSTSGDISDQISSLESAFDRFSDYEEFNYFRSGITGTNWLSIILNDDVSTSQSWEFQRITSQTMDITDPSSLFSTIAGPTDITFFGRFTPSSSDFETISYDASYGPINFELFGDRKSITLSLFKRNTNYLYSFSPVVGDNSTYILDKLDDYTMYQGNDYWYRLIKDFDVSNNLYSYVQDPLSIQTKYLIQTEELIETINNKWNAYSLYPLNISLMGINPVKDIDYTVYDASLGFQSEYFYRRCNDISTYEITLEKDEVKAITTKSCYVIKSGTGNILIGASTNYYDASTVFNTYDASAYVWPITTTTISYPILDGSVAYTSYESISEEDVSDYYYSQKILKTSLTSPTISKWVGLGTDCRNNPFRLILNSSLFIDNSANFYTNFIPYGISNASSYKNEISYPVFKYLSPGVRNWEDYIYYDINDVINYEENNIRYYETIKNLMFSHPTIDIFSKLIYTNKDIDKIKERTTLVYYNQYKNTVDTIFLGLNLSISIADSVKNVINIRKYNKYRFSFISTSSKNRDSFKPIEIIINENTQTILMLWYQGNDILNYNKRYSTTLPGKSLLDETIGYNKDFRSFKTEPNWSFIKTPFVVNNSTVKKTIVDLYEHKINWVDDVSIIRPYFQFNYNLNNVNSIWCAYSNDNDIISYRIFDTDKSYNTFSQKVSYSYLNNINTYGNTVTNYGYKFKTNENLYINNTCNLDTLKSLISYPDQYIMSYIIQENGRLSNNDFNFSPINIRINSPRSFNGIYTYNGWFKPKFDSILEFKTNEDLELIDILDLDFTMSNTNLRIYNNIDQLWYNDVVYSVSKTDAELGNAISYSSFNPFKSQWDASYYVYRNESEDLTAVDGFQCTKELPAFFGSKLVKLPNEITLESWNSTNATYTYDDNYYRVSFNLTRAITNLFTYNLTFVSNWSGLSNVRSSIDLYIKDTIIGYYNISTPKIKLDLYYKTYDAQRLHYIYDNDFILGTKENINAQLYYENDEYIYRILIPREFNYSIFGKIILTEK